MHLTPLLLLCPVCGPHYCLILKETNLHEPLNMPPDNKIFKGIANGLFLSIHLLMHMKVCIVRSKKSGKNFEISYKKQL